MNSNVSGGCAQGSVRLWDEELSIQKKPPNETELSLQKAVAMAQNLETVEWQSSQMHQTSNRSSPGDGDGVTISGKDSMEGAK